jgi:sec-independent protein translocase protein TatC
MTEADEAEIEASKAPLIEHLMELRERLIRSLLAFLAMFICAFFFAKDIYNVLVAPYTQVAGPDARLIYTAPQEYFFTQIKVALFAAAFLSCPIVLSQIYAFVAPGLYRHERAAFRPYLFATPIFFGIGGLASLAAFDLDWGAAVAHFSLYVLVTATLRWLAGFPPI